MLFEFHTFSSCHRFSFTFRGKGKAAKWVCLHLCGLAGEANPCVERCRAHWSPKCRLVWRPQGVSITSLFPHGFSIEFTCWQMTAVSLMSMDLLKWMLYLLIIHPSQFVVPDYLKLHGSKEDCVVTLVGLLKGNFICNERKAAIMLFVCCAMIAIKCLIPLTCALFAGAIVCYLCSPEEHRFAWFIHLCKLYFSLCGTSMLVVLGKHILQPICIWTLSQYLCFGIRRLRPSEWMYWGCWIWQTSATHTTYTSPLMRRAASFTTTRASQKALDVVLKKMTPPTSQDHITHIQRSTCTSYTRT